jgi:hypothetical protein
VARRLRRERAAAIATYRRELAARAVAARRALVWEGVHLGGPAPYGYRLREDRRLMPDAATAHAVRLIFQWTVGENLRPAVIARMLRGYPWMFPSPVRPDGMPGGWTGRAVRAILANPRYTGRHVLAAATRRNGSYLPAVLTPHLVHPPLVGDGLWRLAQPPGRALPAALTPIEDRHDERPWFEQPGFRPGPGSDMP